MCRIVAISFGWSCGIRFRDFSDALGYARRNRLTRDFYGGHSRFAIVEVDAYGGELPWGRTEI